MARPDPAVELRARATRRGRDVSSGSDPSRPDDRPRLRLVVTRGRLGAELEAPVALAPLTVTALEVSFPEVAFPGDLSGGITAFRHRRGQLERVVVSLEAGALSRWVRPRLGADPHDTPWAKDRRCLGPVSRSG